MDFSTHTPQGQNKIDRYGWVTTDSPGDLRMLHKDDLRIHPAYQRDVVLSKVAMITASWSWLSLGAIVVGERGGEYWVIDGQHRVLAAKRRADITMLPCVVFRTKDVSSEARGFLDLNTNRKPVTAKSKHKAMVAAEDEVAIYVQQACDALGLRISMNGNSAGEIKCVAWCYDRAKEDKAAFRDVLALGAELCERAEIPVSQKLLWGLWILHTKCGGGLSDKRLVKRIREKGARVLIDAANRAAAYYASGGGKVWAQGILAELNKGLQHKFTLPGAEDGQP